MFVMGTPCDLLWGVPLFSPQKIAILVVAIIHLLTNILKVSLFRRYVDRKVLKRFGIL